MICEQCRTYEAQYIDDNAALWCPRCVRGRPYADDRPYLWAISERIHFLTTVYPSLRYSSLLQDQRNRLWAAKLGLSLVPPGQRAVDQPPAGEGER